jgi:gamma-glutamyltranspeptidase/glutathione hydrolase
MTVQRVNLQNGMRDCLPSLGYEPKRNGGEVAAKMPTKAHSPNAELSVRSIRDAKGQGVVVAPHFLASAAGARVLREGGNAVDAAVAANAVLCVVYPHMCGIGGDLFALTYEADKNLVRALNGSGPAPQAADRTAFGDNKSIPFRGTLPVTVPGAVASWDALLQEAGTWPLSDVLSDAIGLAEEGFEVSTRVAAWIANDYETIRLFPETARILLTNSGEPPTYGDRLAFPELAETLRRLGELGAREFYEGFIARQIVEAVQLKGGLLTEADLAAYQPIWCTPCVMSYGDVRLHTTPPNSQGLAYLLLLRLFESERGAQFAPGSYEWIRRLVEAKRTAFRVRDTVVGDPAFLERTIDDTLDDAELDALLAKHGEHSAATTDQRLVGDTIAVASLDADGNACSLIESLYFAFGSMETVGGTGILLHNRGSYFSLDPASKACVSPGKRPLHTLMPVLATEKTTGSLRFVLGTMGGDGQPQTLAQITSRVCDSGTSLGEAIDAPRFLDGRFVLGEDPDVLSIEARFEPEVNEALETTYRLQITQAYDERMGHACGVVIDDLGAFEAAADPRGDGTAERSERGDA